MVAPLRLVGRRIWQWATISSRHIDNLLGNASAFNGLDDEFSLGKKVRFPTQTPQSLSGT